MPKRAFSLIEVVLAVGVFASAVVVVLALLPALTSRAANASDALVAQRLPGALSVELQRLAATGGFDALAANLPVVDAELVGGLALVSTRDGARLHSLRYLAPSAPDALRETEQYFLVEVWRFPAAPLAYDPSGTVLAVHVRVSWPYRVASTGTPVALADRATLLFSTAINR